MKENGPIKIAFVGTLSSGKTTVIESLTSKYGEDKSVVFVPEAARIYFQDNPLTNGAIPNAKDARLIQEMQIKMEEDAHMVNPRIIFCDRSVFDAAVYSRVFGTLNYSEKLYLKMADRVSTYSKFFLLDPRDVPHVPDEVRWEDEATREKLHNTFMEFFDEKKIPYELLSGTIEERLARIDQVLN